MALPKDKSAGGLSDEEKARIEEESARRQSEHDNAEKEKKQSSKKGRRKNTLLVAGSAVGLAVVIGGVVTAVNDPFEWFDNTDYGDAVDDDTSQPDGSNQGPPVDNSDETESSTTTDYPIEIPEFSEGPYNSVVNDEHRQNYAEEWSQWELPEDYERMTIEDAEDAEVGSLEGESEWLSDRGRAYDPRLDDENSEYVGYQWRDGVEEWARLNVPNIESVAQQYPSRADNYTSNPDFVYLEDGSFNPFYSLLTTEDVEYFFGNSVQRFLNPVFGEWGMFQHPEGPFDSVVEGFPADNFRSLFTEDWWNENIENGDASNLPVLADWNEDDYGGLDLVQNNERWFGEITSHDISVEGSSADTEILSSMGVEYTSYDSSGGTVSREGTLEITVVPNIEDLSDPDNRLIISDVSFSVEGI